MAAEPMTQPAVFFRAIPRDEPGGMPLILLHGSGGDENSLIPLAAELAPASPVVSLRGSVEIDGGYAFFHRRADRTIDEDDLEARIPALVERIGSEGRRNGFGKPPIAVGFSNGAIMAAALLLTHPALLSGVILFRPLSPFQRDRVALLNGKPVLILDGEKDTRRSPGDGTRLAKGFDRAGAEVTHRVLRAGHAITDADKEIARGWLYGLN